MIALLTLLLTPSHAGTWLEAHGQGVGQISGPFDNLSGVGLGVGAALEMTPRFQAEVTFEGQVHPQGSGRAGAYGGFRLMSVPADRKAVNPSLAIGAGLWGPVVHPLGVVRFDLDVPTPGPAHLRLGLSGRTDFGKRYAVGVHIGAVGRLGALKPRVMAVSETDEPVIDAVVDPNDATDPATVVDEPVADPVAVSTERAWDPEQCEYIDAPVTAAGTSDGTDAPDQNNVSQVPNSSDPSATPQGWLMLVASSGDVIRTGDIEQVVSRDGFARLRVPEGIIDVTVVGGGREQVFEAAVADSFALWLRAAPPKPILVRFPANSATLRDADKEMLRGLANKRGAWNYQVTGSYSAEGNQTYNEALAQRRARSVAEFLNTLKMPDVLLTPPSPPREGLDINDQRAVYVQPVSPKEAE